MLVIRQIAILAENTEISGQERLNTTHELHRDARPRANELFN